MENTGERLQQDDVILMDTWEREVSSIFCILNSTSAEHKHLYPPASFLIWWTFTLKGLSI